MKKVIKICHGMKICDTAYVNDVFLNIQLKYTIGGVSKVPFSLEQGFLIPIQSL